MRKWLSLVVALSLLLGLFGGSASAGKESRSQRFTVVLKGEAVTNSALTAIAKAGGTVESRVDKIGVLTVRSDNPTSFLKTMLKNNEIVAIGPSLRTKLEQPVAEPRANGTSPATPADPGAYTWGVDRVTNDGAAWAIHRGTHRVVVGIIDTGLDLSHPDLIGNILPGSKTFVPGTVDAWDQNGHGTHVAGIIAADGRVKGVAPGVGIRSYRVFDQDGAEDSWILAAIIAAADDGVDVINMSLGGWGVHGQWIYTDPGTGEQIKLGNDTATIVAYKRALQYATKRGATVVAAAGNDGVDLASKGHVTDWLNWYLHEALELPEYSVQGATFNLPGGLPGVIQVSAMGGGWGTAERLAYYSNFGNGAIDLTAPGGDVGPDPSDLDADYWKYFILSTTPSYLPCNLPMSLFGTCEYGFKAGTSMAAPHVAGAAALYISSEYDRTGKKPSPSQVAVKLQQTTERIGKGGHDQYFGKGLVSAYWAINGK